MVPDDDWFQQQGEECRLSVVRVWWGGEEIPRRLPDSVGRLCSPRRFNTPVGDALAAHLPHLTFGWCYNYSVEQLPQGLIHLTMGKSSNQRVDNMPDAPQL